MRCSTVSTCSMETTSWSAIVLASSLRAPIFEAEIAPTTTRATITTPKARPRRYASLRLLKRDTEPPRLYRGGKGRGRGLALAVVIALLPTRLHANFGRLMDKPAGRNEHGPARTKPDGAVRSARSRGVTRGL